MANPAFGPHGIRERRFVGHERAITRLADRPAVAAGGIGANQSNSLLSNRQDAPHQECPAYAKSQSNKSRCSDKCQANLKVSAFYYSQARLKKQ